MLSVAHPEVFRHTITYTVFFLRKTRTQLVALWNNADGHLLDKIPKGYTFFIFYNGLQRAKYVCLLENKL